MRKVFNTTKAFEYLGNKSKNRLMKRKLKIETHNRISEKKVKRKNKKEIESSKCIKDRQVVNLTKVDRRQNHLNEVEKEKSDGCHSRQQFIRRI